MLMSKREMEDLYDTVFSLDFLIRYGYYDIKMKKIDSKYVIDEDLEEYYGKIENFYFRIFNLIDIGKLVSIDADNFKQYFNFNKLKKNCDTEPIYFSIPKDEYTRRQYKMPNIYSYIMLSIFLENNKKKIIDIFLTNIQSTSKFFGLFGFDYKYTKKLGQKLIYGGNNLLKLDLSNFYHTLYTHSIPWVIDGKEKSKRNRQGGFANDLDQLIQKCQYGETYGLPTGNLASTIIAELYMCYIDKYLIDKNYRYARYVDDILFSFSTDEKKESFLLEFSKICRDYNLIINKNKTQVIKFPYTNKDSKVDIFSYFDDLINLDDVDKWKDKMNEFLNLCIHEESEGNKGAVKCIFSVILNTFNRFENKQSNINVSKKIEEIILCNEQGSNFNVYERIMDTSLKNSILCNKFVVFTEKLIEKNINKSIMKRIAQNYFLENQFIYRDKISHYIKNEWNQEIYQILLYGVILNVKKLFLKKSLVDILRSNLDDYSMSLTLIMWIKKKYPMKELLDILENKLSRVHLMYDTDSIRMQEKYWLLRYFIFTLIDKEIISKDILEGHYKTCSKNKKGIVKSELNKTFVLIEDKPLNRFYKFLLDKKVELVRTTGKSGELFEYL